MSERSESYHIRTDEPEITTQKLIDAGINGFLFTPKNGWLTFVPYDIDGELVGGKMTDELIAASRKPVLNYTCHEDFGWCLEYKLPEAVLKTEPFRPEFWFQFDCWWDPDQNLRDENGVLESSRFDHAAFCHALGRPDLEAEMKKIIQVIDPSEIDEDDYPDGFGPAWDFGKALGLPVSKYLSSEYVQEGPENYVEYGLREIGMRPKQSASGRGSVPTAGEARSAKTSAKPSDNIIDMLKGLLGRRK